MRPRAPSEQIPQPPPWDPPAPTPETPPEGPAPAPPQGPQPVPIPPPGRPPARPPVPGTGRRYTPPTQNGWLTWWEYNREHLLGLRKQMRERIVLTGDGAARWDPLGARRGEALTLLREIAKTDDERNVRASAMLALGRAGGDEDARFLVETLSNEKESQDLREAAAVAIGILPPFHGDDVGSRVRDYLVYVLRHPQVASGRARGLAICAAGLRGRSDQLLRMEMLGLAAAGDAEDAEEVTHLAFACGLAGDAAAAPELLNAARTGEMGGADLTDVQRAHNVAAFGRVTGAGGIDSLASILRSRRSGLETKRAAVLALGRVLRETPPGDAAAADRAGRALRECFEKESDGLIRGYAAVALGCAQPPQSLPLLMEAIDHGGNALVKPFCALALGFGARTLGGDEARRIGIFLRDELEKTNDLDLGSALSLALGLAKAEGCEKQLLERVAMERLSPLARGAAAQAIGLVGTASQKAIDTLKIAAQSGTPGVLEDAALALGLLGQRAIAKDLVAELPRLGSAAAQARLMLALSYLAHAESVEPLLTILRDKKAQVTAREFAAVAIGILGDAREQDQMFEIDAWFNLNATTVATNELIRLY